MKTETKENKSMVAQLREIRDQMSLEIQDMNSEQMLAYFNNKKGLLPQEMWQQKEKDQQNQNDQILVAKDNAAVDSSREG